MQTIFYYTVGWLLPRDGEHPVGPAVRLLGLLLVLAFIGVVIGIFSPLT